MMLLPIDCRTSGGSGAAFCRPGAGRGGDHRAEGAMAQSLTPTATSDIAANPDQGFVLQRGQKI